MIRILVVDDQNIIREGIKVLLESAAKIEIVAIANDGESALKKIASEQPDIVLLDISLPGIDGLTVAQEINSKFPEVKVIMLSSHEDKSYVAKATESGARGYLLKSVSAEELEWAIKLVHQGYSAFRSELLTTLTPINKSEFQVPKRKEIAKASPPGAGTFAKSPASSSSQSNFSRQPVSKQPESATIEALLAKKQIQQRYSRYANYSTPSRRDGMFNSLKYHQFRKTLASFEFQLLIFVIIFSLAFLVFVALS